MTTTRRARTTARYGRGRRERETREGVRRCGGHSPGFRAMGFARERVVWTRDARDWGWVVEERCVRSVPFVRRDRRAVCAGGDGGGRARRRDGEARERARETDPKTTDGCLFFATRAERKRCRCRKVWM